MNALAALLLLWQPWSAVAYLDSWEEEVSCRVTRQDGEWERHCDVQDLERVTSLLERAPHGLTPSLKNEQLTRYSIKYEPFHQKLPVFENEEDKKLFMKQPENLASLDSHKPDSEFGSHLNGEIIIMTPGKFNFPNMIEDGPSARCHREDQVLRFEASDVERENAVKAQPDKHSKQLTFFVGAEGESFQHFIDNLLPKVVQAKDFMTDKIDILRKDSWPIVEEMWEQMGYPKSWNKPLVGNHIADELLVPCNVPRLHPSLWQGAQKLLGVDRDKVGSKVILLVRSNSNTHNKGRVMHNQGNVEELLKMRYGADFEVFDAHSKPGLGAAKQAFQNAKLVIGAHGGALYNALFAPKTASVLEFLPLGDNGLLPGQSSAADWPRLAHRAIWHNSNMLEQAFYRLHPKAMDSMYNFLVDEAQLKRMLDKIDGQMPHHKPHAKVKGSEMVEK